MVEEHLKQWCIFKIEKLEHDLFDAQKEKDDIQARLTVAENKLLELGDPVDLKNKVVSVTKKLWIVI